MKRKVVRNACKESPCSGERGRGCTNENGLGAVYRRRNP